MNEPNKVNIVTAEYLVSAVGREQYPEVHLPEIAFIGRSNVGKSSLINSLCNRKNLARTSGAPGKTQTLNFYKVAAKLPDETREYFYLVDLPGYGYAKRGKSSRKEWSKFTEEYWLKSENLRLVCQLIDIRHPPMSSDINAYEWFTAHNLPVMLIATKADKISKGQIKKQLLQISTGLSVSAGAEIIPYSAVTGSGKSTLLEVIASILTKNKS